MRSDLDFPRQELLGPVVFRPTFNRSEAISGNQAWSLFFTAGQEDKILGYNSETGRLFTNLLVAVASAGVVWAILFTKAI
ncbi:hypothetical protein [Leptolyngbya sp. PCC 6406]|uniref:hypothetical protein n=1 Tax=Leptolyngbya sp. PCC 6406 TaxID=1173264 RepID=UPI0002AC1858|nr:hypothetical protein [Leptolyngbya sp. PCC 6406]